MYFIIGCKSCGKLTMVNEATVEKEPAENVLKCSNCNSESTEAIKRFCGFK